MVSEEISERPCAWAMKQGRVVASSAAAYTLGAMLALSKVSETATTITLRWTPPANVGGYVFYANGQIASVATKNLKDGSPRKEVKFSKTTPGPPFEIAAVCRGGNGVFSLEAGSYGVPVHSADTAFSAPTAKVAA